MLAVGLQGSLLGAKGTHSSDPTPSVKVESSWDHIAECVRASDTTCGLQGRSLHGRPPDRIAVLSLPTTLHEIVFSFPPHARAQFDENCCGSSPRKERLLRDRSTSDDRREIPGYHVAIDADSRLVTELRGLDGLPGGRRRLRWSTTSIDGTGGRLMA